MWPGRFLLGPCLLLQILSSLVIAVVISHWTARRLGGQSAAGVKGHMRLWQSALLWLLIGEMVALVLDLPHVFETNELENPYAMVLPGSIGG